MQMEEPGSPTPLLRTCCKARLTPAAATATARAAAAATWTTAATARGPGDPTASTTAAGRPGDPTAPAAAPTAAHSRGILAALEVLGPCLAALAGLELPIDTVGVSAGPGLRSGGFPGPRPWPGRPGLGTAAGPLSSHPGPLVTLALLQVASLVLAEDVAIAVGHHVVPAAPGPHLGLGWPSFGPGRLRNGAVRRTLWPYRRTIPRTVRPGCDAVTGTVGAHRWTLTGAFRPH